MIIQRVLPWLVTVAIIGSFWRVPPTAKVTSVLRFGAKHGADHLRGIDQPGSYAPADRDTTAYIGIEGSAIPEGEKFAQDAIGVFEPEEAVLGPAFVGEGILGLIERQRNRRGMEEVHRRSKAR